MSKPPTLELASSGRLPKARRIRRRREFLHIQKHGIRVHSTGFIVIVDFDERAAPRLGCVVSRRVGHAVTRNRVRRLMKEVFRRVVQQLPPADFVLIAKPEAARLAERGLDVVFRDLEPAFIRVMKKRMIQREKARLA